MIGSGFEDILIRVIPVLRQDFFADYGIPFNYGFLI